MALLQTVRRKYLAVRGSLSERARRLWAGAEAEAHGRGGVLNYEAFISARRDLRGVMNKNISQALRRRQAQIRFDRDTAE